MIFLLETRGNSPMYTLWTRDTSIGNMSQRSHVHFDNTTEHLLRKILIPEDLKDPPDNQGKLYYTVTPVLRGHIWDKQKVAYKTGDLLKEVKFIWKFLFQDKNNLTF
jgi:hypothetical protein